MSDYPSIFNAKIETMGADERRSIQESKLKLQLAYVNQHSSFYREKFTAAGLIPSDIKGIDDLVSLPFSTKDEIRASQEEEPPLGKHMACSWDKVARIYSSSGTSGKPCYIGVTRHDLEVWFEIAARSFYAVGLRPHRKLVVTSGAGPFIAGAGYGAFEKIGATIIPLGPGHTDRMISLFRDVGADCVSSTPSYVFYLANYCRDRGINPTELGVKSFFVAGEPGGGIPSVRQNLEMTFNAEILETMGIGDFSPAIFGECPCKQGMHFSAPEFIIPELVDPESGEAMEMRDGAEGELVYTAIDRECVPLVRFRSRDHVTVWTSPCDCGRTGFRIRCWGRTDDMFIVLGVNVYPSAVKDVVCSLRPRTTGEIQIRLAGTSSNVQPPVPIIVEYGKEAGDLDSLRRELESLIRERLIFRASIELVPDGALPKSEYKGRLVTRE